MKLIDKIWLFCRYDSAWIEEVYEEFIFLFGTCSPTDLTFFLLDFFYWIFFIPVHWLLDWFSDFFFNFNSHEPTFYLCVRPSVCKLYTFFTILESLARTKFHQTFTKHHYWNDILNCLIRANIEMVQLIARHYHCNFVQVTLLFLCTLSTQAPPFKLSSSQHSV